MGNERIYVCHTFYHVYVTCLKELHLLHRASLSRKKAGKGSGEAGRATLVLSKMSNDFSPILERAKKCPLFAEVIEYDEKRDTFFEELLPLRKDTGNIFKNMINRIRFCRRFPELQEPYVPVDFTKYDDIYVFCDIDPVGYYLNGKRIPFHAVEDGLDTLADGDDAIRDNRPFFAIKKWMAQAGLIYIRHGYARYCIDMEVNDLTKLKHRHKKMIGVRRDALAAELTQTDKELLLDLFLADAGEIRKHFAKAKDDTPQVLMLTEPVCEDRTMRKKLFLDMVAQYGTVGEKKARIYVKQHPRDDVDYTDVFDEDVILLDKNFPMEMLYYIEGIHFERVVSVYTHLDEMEIADEKIRLGDAFMDAYEDPEKHWNSRKL